MNVEPMLALSVRQPWAWLLVQGLKDVENRSWSTRVRGRIWIHAGKAMSRGDYEACDLFVRGISTVVLPKFDELARGGLVGQVTLRDCVSASASKWFCGEYGFVVAEGKALERMLPCAGALGFFRPVVNMELPMG